MTSSWIPLLAVHLTQPEDAHDKNTLPSPEISAGWWTWVAVTQDFKYLKAGTRWLEVDHFTSTGQDLSISEYDIEEALSDDSSVFSILDTPTPDEIVTPTEIAETWRGWYPQSASPSAAVAAMVNDRHADKIQRLRAENKQLRQWLKDDWERVT